MMGKDTLKWTAYIAGGAMAVALILPFVTRYGGTDDNGNDWQVTTGVNAVEELARQNARGSFPVFIEALERTGADAEGFGVEVELRSKRGVPTAVWLENINVSQNDMAGALTVTPPGGLRGDLVKGDVTSFTRLQVLDWKYPEEGRWRGYFLLRVISRTFSQEEQARIRASLHESPLP